MFRRILTAIALLLLTAACADREPEAFESTAPSETSTTTTAVTAAPTTTTSPAAGLETAPIDQILGVGDSLYPGLGNGGYDVAHYDVDLTFDPEAAVINARVAIEATATANLKSFSLDLVGFAVTEVTVDDAAAAFDRMAGELIIDSPSVIPAGEAFVTTVSYNGAPNPVLSQASFFDVGWRTDPSGVSYVIGEPDGGRNWLPLNDHPSDKATYTFRITVPDPLIAAANGIHVETITDLGWATWVWESAQPMASYLATVVIGDLAIVPDAESTTRSGVVVRNVIPGDLSSASLQRLALHGEMIEFFEGVLGPYPFDAYGLAVVDDFEAALENQTLSIFGRYMVDIPEFFEIVMVHELVHQWFGNSVTPADWGDIWLNEGFATYGEWLWLEHRHGEQAMLATIQGERDRMAISDYTPPGSPPANDLFNASVYIRGGLVLHALRIEIGDEAFFDLLREYVHRYRYDVVTTNDFIALAESVSGQDLEALFDKWLYGPKVPQLP